MLIVAIGGSEGENFKKRMVSREVSRNMKANVGEKVRSIQ